MPQSRAPDPRASSPRPSRSGREIRGPNGPSSSRTGALGLPVGCGLLLAGAGSLLGAQPTLAWTLVGAGGFVLAWAALLFAAARRTGRALSLEKGIYRHHWVQVCAQLVVLLYWGWHVRFVYAFLPLMLAQIVFAYAVDSLLQLSRRDTYRVGFGPIPVIFSINLFLWFRVEWFYWQFVMILLGYLGKEFIRWQRGGRSAHIFNPSSFPLAVFALALILTQASEITFGQAIATSQYYPPNMYLVIFLAAIPGQLLFGVARMTLSAVVTAVLISTVYFEVTGTYLFFDSHIPVPVFLGMHLLFTDPSTSPRTGSGRIIFGVLYGSATAILYVVLTSVGLPTFYDKLLPVPILNLMVRGIDRVAATKPAELLDPRVLGRERSPTQRNLVYTSLWAGAFALFSSLSFLGDAHPGQALPFWQDACDSGLERACGYYTAMTSIYCGDGSGWACNEWGVRRVRTGEPTRGAFRRACSLGFEPGCANARRVAAGSPPERAPPTPADMPIVLRGTKPPLHGLSAERLIERACRHGWEGACDGSLGGGDDGAG